MKIMKAINYTVKVFKNTFKNVMRNQVKLVVFLLSFCFLYGSFYVLENN